MNEEEQTGLGGGKDIPPWLQPVPEDENDTSFWQAHKTVIITASVAVVLLGLFVSVLVYLYDDTAGGPPRHVTASSEPVREKPSEAGGMRVPHQDKEVFNQIDGDKPRNTVRLGEQPEQPVEIPADDPVDTSVDVVGTVITEMQKAAPSVEEQKPLVKEPAVQPKNKTKPVVKKAKPGTVAEAAPKATSAYQVQLGAYGSEKSAANAWRSVKNKFPDQFKGKTSTFEPVSSGDRTLYRLRVGPLDSRVAADQVCLALRSSAQACIVVNP